MSFNLKKKLKKTLKGGFTLVELLICIVIFSVILLITTQSILVITRKAGVAKLRAETNENARYAIETIKRDLRESNTTVTTNLNCGNTLASSCIFPDSSGQNLIKFCRSSDGVLYKGIYSLSDTVSVNVCNATEGNVTLKKVSNSDILYINSLAFEPNADKKYYNIKINYTDIRGSLCKKDDTSKCVTLSSGVVIRRL